MLKQTVAGRVIGLNDAQTHVAIAQGNNLCIYPVEPVSKTGSEKNIACYPFPNLPQSAKWSKDQQNLSVVVDSPEHNDHNIWRLNLATKEKSVIWPNKNTVTEPQAAHVVFHLWISNQQLITGRPCGNECTALEITNIDISTDGSSNALTPPNQKKPVDDISYLITEGHVRWLKEYNRLVGMGHGGELVSLTVPLATLTAVPKPKMLLPGCIGDTDAQQWWRFEDALSATQWLLSKQHCEAGAWFALGAPLAIYQPKNGRIETLPVTFTAGSPATVSRNKQFIAAIGKHNNKATLSIFNTPDNNLLMQLPLADYLRQDYLTDQSLEQLKPIWSLNDSHLLIPIINVIHGELFFQASIVDLRSQTITPFNPFNPNEEKVKNVEKATRFYWMQQQTLLMQSKAKRRCVFIRLLMNSTEDRGRFNRRSCRIAKQH